MAASQGDRLSKMEKKITTIFFCLDNTLVLSEALVYEERAAVINSMACAYGSDEKLTGRFLRQSFSGMNFPEVVEKVRICDYDNDHDGMRFAMFKGGIPETELDAYAKLEDDSVTAKMQEKPLQPCPGVLAKVSRLVAEKQYTLAVVSSSTLARAQATLDSAGMSPYFSPDHIFCATDSLQTTTSEWKSSESTFKHAMKVLGKKADECVVVTNSWRVSEGALVANIGIIGYTGGIEDMDDPERIREVLIDPSFEHYSAYGVIEMKHWSELRDRLAYIDIASKVYDIRNAHKVSVQ